MENNTQQPEKKSKFTWGHGIVAALLAFVVFILSLIIYFTQTMQNSELITDNYYQEELQYQQVIDAKNRAYVLQEKPQVAVQQDGVKITFPEQLGKVAHHLNFYLYRTDDKNLDIKKEFQLENQQFHLIPANILKTGSYTLRLMWQENGEQYQIDYDILWK